jgi:hypothetical protein
MSDEIVRCPFCVLGHNPWPMEPKQEELFSCQECGHKVMLGKPNFKCFCQKCMELRRAA